MLGQHARMKRRAAVIALSALLSFLACLAAAALADWIRLAARDPPLDLEPLAMRLRQSVLPGATGPFISEGLRFRVADAAARSAYQRVLEMTIPKRPDILAAVIVSPDNRILAAYPGRERLVGRSLRSNRLAFAAPPVGFADLPRNASGDFNSYPTPPGGGPPGYGSSGGSYGSGGPPGYPGAPSSPAPPTGGYGSGGPPGPPAGGSGGPPGYARGGPGTVYPYPIPTDPGSRLRALLDQVLPGGWPEDLMQVTMYSHRLFVLHNEGVYALTVLPRLVQPAYGLSAHYLWPASQIGAALSFAVYWLMLPWWVYLDARWRAGKALPLALLVLLTNFLGWLTYLVIRPEGNQLCPVCVNLLEPSFRICPHCGWSRALRCRQCGRALRSDWRFCPYCEAPRTDAAQGEEQPQ